MSKKLLWIDDQIAHYKSFVQGLKNRGFTITTADTVERGLSAARTKKFDLILVDLRMKQTTGFDAIRALRRITPGTPLCVLSSYLHLPEYQDRINRISTHIATLDKDLPDPDTRAFDIFANKISRLIESPPSLSPRDFERRIIDKQIDPFEIPFRHYMNLPSRIKRHLTKKAEDQARHTIENEFKSGKVWVLLCGSASDVVYSAESDSEIPTSHAIIQKALELDRAPYQFSAPESIDDLWSGDCLGGSNQKSYPTVTCRIDNSDKWTIHFDTGSPWTFLSFEELNELGVIDADALAVSGSRAGNPYQYLSQSLKVMLIDQRTGSTRVITVRVRAVKNWLHSPFVAPCPEFCNYAKRFGDTQNCINRKGLVGRNLLQETGISLTLHGKDNKTQISGARRRKATREAL